MRCNVGENYGKSRTGAIDRSHFILSKEAAVLVLISLYWVGIYKIKLIFSPHFMVLNESRYSHNQRCGYMILARHVAILHCLFYTHIF